MPPLIERGIPLPLWAHYRTPQLHALVHALQPCMHGALLVVKQRRAHSGLCRIGSLMATTTYDNATGDNDLGNANDGEHIT